MFLKIKALCFFLLFLFPLSSSGQFFVELTEKLVTDEINSLVFPYLKSEKQAAFVFDSRLPLEFKSNKEILPSVIQSGNYQILLVSAGPNAISVIYDGSPTVLNYGQLVNLSKPSLKPKEIKYFSVSLQSELEIVDLTESELKRGNQTLPVGPNISDALVTLRLFPSDLEFRIEEENNLITKISKDNGQYLVFLETSKTNLKDKLISLKLISSNGETKSIPIYDLKAKDTRFYRVKKPLAETISPTSSSSDTNSGREMLSKVIGKWSGTLGSEISHLEILPPTNDINSISARMFIQGIYFDFIGNYSQSETNKINFSLKKQRLGLYDFIDATIDFEYSDGILSGVYLDSNKDAYDISMLKSTKIPENQNLTIEKRISELAEILIAKWTIEDIFFKNMTIEKIDYRNTIYGTLQLQNGNCGFEAKILGVKGNLSFTIKTAKNCKNLDFDLVVNINRSSTVSIINNTRGDLKNVGFFKLNNISQKEARIEHNSIGNSSIDEIFVVNKDKVYFYSEPNINTIRRAYLVKGQMPEIISENSNFYYVRYNHLGTVTTGYIKNTDLDRLNINKLFSNSVWTGKFGDNQIQIVLTKFQKQNDKEIIVLGYNKLKQNSRPIEGMVASFYKDGINVILDEPGDDNWDGRFTIGFNFDGQASGVWKSFNNKITRNFNLKRQ